MDNHRLRSSLSIWEIGAGEFVIVISCYTLWNDDHCSVKLPARRPPCWLSGEDDDAGDDSSDDADDDEWLFSESAGDDTASDSDADSSTATDPEKENEEHALEGFDTCSVPETDDLESLLPTEDDVDGLSNAGGGSGTAVGVERVSKTFQEGGATDVNTVVGHVEEPPFHQNQLSQLMAYADSAHAEKLAYVIAEEYIFTARVRRIARPRDANRVPVCQRRV